jgi:F-type H+-transporting ATPase subunit delta
LTSIVLARRYAKALFAMGKEEGKLEDCSAKLKEVYDLLKENPDLELALTNPVFPADRKMSVMEQVMKLYSIEGALASFFTLLVERNRVQYLKPIMDAFQEFIDEETGVVRAVVRAPVPLTDEITQQLKEVMAKVSGKEVVLQVKEDPSVIGGMIAHIGDTIWDGSIKSQLQGLKQNIERGE